MDLYHIHRGDAQIIDLLGKYEDKPKAVEKLHRYLAEGLSGYGDLTKIGVRVKIPARNGRPAQNGCSLTSVKNGLERRDPIFVETALQVYSEQTCNRREHEQEEVK